MKRRLWIKLIYLITDIALAFGFGLFTFRYSGVVGFSAFTDLQETSIFIYAGALALLHVLVFIFTKVYNILSDNFSIEDALKVAGLSTIVNIFGLIAILAIPNKILFFQWQLLISWAIATVDTAILMISVRFVTRLYRRLRRVLKDQKSVRTLVIGAGSAAKIVIDDARFNKDNNRKIVEVVDVYQRVKDALNAVNYDSLPIGEPYGVTSLSEKELTAIINDSFIESKDEEVKSNLTSNTANFSTYRMNVKIVDDITLKYVFDVSVNGYSCNINQDVEFTNDIYDFETHLYAAQEIESGGVKFIGSTNKHVQQLLNVEDNTFTQIKTNQPKAFDCDANASRFDICLIGISTGIPANLQPCPKETMLDSVNKRIDFAITRMM